MPKKTTWDEQQALYDKSPLSHLHPASEDWRRMQPPPYGNFRPGTLNQLRDMVHSLAREKGWYDDVESPPQPRTVAAWLCNIHGEISEALEDVRSGDVHLWYDEKLKPCGLPVELADALIRILDTCGALEIDIEEAMRVKHEYNMTRSHRHGGKAL